MYSQGAWTLLAAPWVTLNSVGFLLTNWDWFELYYLYYSNLISKPGLNRWHFARKVCSFLQVILIIHFNERARHILMTPHHSHRATLKTKTSRTIKTPAAQSRRAAGQRVGEGKKLHNSDTFGSVRSNTWLPSTGQLWFMADIVMSLIYIPLQQT